MIEIENTPPALQGWTAFFEGSLREHNPYPFNSVEYEEWDEGWLSAEETSFD